MKMYEMLRAFVVGGLVLTGAGLQADEFDSSKMMTQYSNPASECCCDLDSCCANSGSRGGHFLFGVEATFLAPIGSTGVQTWEFADLASGANNAFTTDSSGIENLVPAPRVWLGFVNDCGWGAQVRYWELNSSATNTDLFTPQLITGDTTGFNAANTIQMQALDIEAIRNFCYCDWNVTTSFGYRHALRDSQGAMNFIAQVDRPTIIGGQTALYSGASSSISKFEGDGLTFSLAGSRPTCYGIDLFWNMRGSCLWGNSYSSSSAAAAVGTPFGGANFTTGAVSGKSDDIWIGELQAGAQWSRCLPCSNARFFLRGAFEYQYWGSTSGQTFAEAGVFDSGVSGMYVSASSPESSINLVGFALSSGITW